MGRTFSFKDVPSKPFHGWKLSSFTRGKRYSLRGTFVGAFHGEKTFHRGIEGGKKRTTTTTTTMVETRIPRKKGGKSESGGEIFPAGKGEDKGRK